MANSGKARLPLLDEEKLFIIRGLEDEPNEKDGLSADELKAKFDEAGLVIGQYINEELIPAVLAADATEKDRLTAEAARTAAEEGRGQAEEQRQVAEAARAAAEEARGQAEERRETAEAQRAAESQAAIQAARDAAVNGPYVEENGHWMVWDPEIGGYQNSGVSARGTTGERGKDGARGSRIYSTAGMPGAELGTEGDWAIDPTTGDIYHHMFMEEEPIDPAKWSTFIQSLNDYAMIGSPEAFTNGTITLNMVNNDLLLRKADGTPFANWSEVYDGSWAETIPNALYALMVDLDKYAEYWDQNDGCTMIAEPSWYELQYAIIHTDEINTTGVFPSMEDIKAECGEKYRWRYVGVERTDYTAMLLRGGPDPAKWSAFIQGLNDYAMMGSDTAFNDGTITLDIVNDELLLRKADGSKFASWGEVYDGSTCEIICNALFALMADPDKYMELWDKNDGCTLIKEPTWYEFQYAIMHIEEINTTCEFPPLKDVRAWCERKFDSDQLRGEGCEWVLVGNFKGGGGDLASTGEAG